MFEYPPPPKKKSHFMVIYHLYPCHYRCALRTNQYHRKSSSNGHHQSTRQCKLNQRWSDANNRNRTSPLCSTHKHGGQKPTRWASESSWTTESTLSAGKSAVKELHYFCLQSWEKWLVHLITIYYIFPHCCH